MWLIKIIFQAYSLQYLTYRAKNILKSYWNLYTDFSYYTTNNDFLANIEQKWYILLLVIPTSYVECKILFATVKITASYLYYMVRCEFLKMSITSIFASTDDNIKIHVSGSRFDPFMKNLPVTLIVYIYQHMVKFSRSSI